MIHTRWAKSLYVAALVLVVFPVWRGGALTSRAMAAGLIAQDLDGDGDVDDADLSLFLGCLSGPAVSYSSSATCRAADVDQDGDVDMADFGILQRCYSASGIPADPACGGCALPKADLQVTVASTTIVAGLSADVLVVASQVGANYQLRNSVGNVNVGSPVAGTGDTIILPTNILTSNTTFNVLAMNALWGCSTPLTATVTITVLTGTPNKIGVHVVQGSRNGFGPFVDTCAAAGRPVALVKCVDDFGAASDAKSRSPHPEKTLTIGRKNDLPSCSWGSNCDLQGFDAQAESGKNPAQHAQDVFNALLPIWGQNPSIDVWEVCNEWSWWWSWQADFYIAMMDLAEAHNPPYRIALFSCSVGNPPQAYWPDIARACARAKAHGNHILALHEYGYFTSLLQDSYNAQYGLVLRYRQLYNYLATQNAVVPLALTEVGQGGGGGFVGTTLFVQDFGWYDSQLRQDPYVIGCAAWTLGNWSGANFQDALPALGQYIASH